MSKSWSGTIEGVKWYFPLFNAIFCYLFLGYRKGLWGQFYGPKLPPIHPTIEVAFVKHDIRNISAFGEDGIGADKPELQGKTRLFQNGRLWGPFSPGSGLAVESSLDHVTYPPSFTPGKWNFWATSKQKKASLVGGSKLANFISRLGL